VLDALRGRPWLVLVYAERTQRSEVSESPMLSLAHRRSASMRRLRTGHSGGDGRAGFGRLLLTHIAQTERARTRGPTKAVLAILICGAFAMLHPSTASTKVPPMHRPAARSLDGMAREVVFLVNLERAQHRLPPLRVNRRLVVDARLQADQIAETGVLDHVILSAAYPTPRVRAEAAGYAWNALGENLALGFSDAPSAVAAWMQSPGHRANILAGGYSETGVVLAPDARGRLIFVQTFGAPE
jgi:uncharacterized protein YkwD